MLDVAAIREFYKGTFKSVESDEERCCACPTCWVGLTWDLRQMTAKVQLKDMYIARLEAKLAKE